MLKLQVIVASTRDGRRGRKVADWFFQCAQKSADFKAELIDLREVNLPLFDEPNHPRLAKYEHAHTKEWSALIEQADAYIFVTPEYNYSAPPALINALDYLSQEWAEKPAAFVGYGGVSGGTRSIEMSKQVLTALNVMPISTAVTIPFFAQYIDEESGKFQPPEVQAAGAQRVLKTLARWARALKRMREEDK